VMARKPANAVATRCFRIIEPSIPRSYPTVRARCATPSPASRDMPRSGNGIGAGTARLRGKSGTVAAGLGNESAQLGNQGSRYDFVEVRVLNAHAHRVSDV
jgi:hypothetical protein